MEPLLMPLESTGRSFGLIMINRETGETLIKGAKIPGLYINVDNCITTFPGPILAPGIIARVWNWATYIDNRCLQEILPDLSRDMRELFITGMTDEDWNAMPTAGEEPHVPATTVAELARDQITIPLTEYHNLLRRSAILTALTAGGVDNWEAYCDSLIDHYVDPITAGTWVEALNNDLITL
jgi:hypothetical protein